MHSRMKWSEEIAGVHTVTVPEVVLKQGSRYSVVITNSGSSYISFGVETSTSYKNSGGGSWFTSTAGIEQNQTFYKGALPTSEWRDGKIANWSVRIKVHTRTLDQSWIPDTPVFQGKRLIIQDIILSPGIRFLMQQDIIYTEDRHLVEGGPRLQQ